MKHNTENISTIVFAHCPSRYTRASQKNLLITILKKRFLASRDYLLCGVATLGIGTVLLVTAYFFFTQLAEHGW